MATYDLAADFSLSSNPNGVWTYGYEDTLGGALNNYDQAYTVTNGLEGWRSSVVQTLGAPNDGKNPTDSTVTNGDEIWRPGATDFHPGLNGQFSVYRFTAPSSGSYAVSASFYPLNTIATTDVHILDNGISLFSGDIDSAHPSQAYSKTLTLNQGDTVDFAVGYGLDGNWVADATGISATITSTPSLTVSVSGTAQEGQVLTASASGSGATFQWQSLADDGTTWSNIPNATANTYTVTEADEAHLLRVKATANGNTADSEPTSPVVDITPTLTVSVSASSPTTLTATADKNDSDSTVAYQWQTSSDGKNWTDIPGATSLTYSPTASDAGHQLRATATLSNPDGASIPPVPSESISVPSSGNSSISLSGNDGTFVGANANYKISGDGSGNTVLLGNGNNSGSISGNDNKLTLGDGNNTVTLAGTGNTATFGNKNNTVNLGGSGNSVTLGNGNNVIQSTGTSNKVTMGSGNDQITSSGSANQNTFILNGSKASLSLLGSQNMVFINGGQDTIKDSPGSSDHLVLNIGASGGSANVSNFSTASGVVDLVGGLGFTSAQDMADYTKTHSDGHGGSLLAYQGGQIDFLGVAPGNLTASNFSTA